MKNRSFTVVVVAILAAIVINVSSCSSFPCFKSEEDKTIQAIIKGSDSLIVCTYLQTNNPKLKSYAVESAKRIIDETDFDEKGICYIVTKAFLTLEKTAGINETAKAFITRSNSDDFSFPEYYQIWTVRMNKVTQLISAEVNAEIKKIVLIEKKDFLWMSRFLPKTEIDQLCIKVFSSKVNNRSAYCYLLGCGDKLLLNSVINSTPDSLIIANGLFVEISPERRLKLTSKMKIEKAVLLYSKVNGLEKEKIRLLSLRRNELKDCELLDYYHRGYVSETYLKNRLELLSATKLVNLYNQVNVPLDDVLMEILISSIKSNSDLLIAAELCGARDRNYLALLVNKAKY